MIAKVMRGAKVSGLLRYLFGPGRANEHTDPHLVASWDDDLVGLEPAHRQRGGRDTALLSRLLEQPVAALARRPVDPVWHCAVRVAPGDRHLSDDEWREVARDVVRRVGLAPDGDDLACRWVAVRHADDHMHVVVTLARQDGAPVKTSNDFYRVGDACQAAEIRLGLTRTPGRDRTAAKRPTRGESEKAARQGRAEPARLTLAREVRTACAGVESPAEFFARLESAGLLVRQRFSEQNPGQVTGYAVALPGDRTSNGIAVWFGGAKLAADLSWPKVTARWVPPDVDPLTPTSPATGAMRRVTRLHVWRDAAAYAKAAAQDVRRLTTLDPEAAGDIAHATSATLAAVARIVEGRHGGPLTTAADAFDRASRTLGAKPAPPMEAGRTLRTVARLLTMTGRATHDDTTHVLALIAALTSLAEAVAQLRQAQDRGAQAMAARVTAGHLRAATRALTPATTRARGQPVVHRANTRAVIHRSEPDPPRSDRPRRR